MEGPLELVKELFRLQGEVIALAVRRYGHRMLWIGAVLISLLFIVFSMHAVFWAVFLAFLPGHFILASLAMLAMDFFSFLFCIYFATKARKPSYDQKEVYREREEKVELLRSELSVSTLLTFLNSPLGKSAVIWVLGWLTQPFFRSKKSTRREDEKRDREAKRRKRMDFSRKGRGLFWRLF
ncbi:hypothetical protein FAI40_06725 [Acetobacteraceae bacterium]|nr:hypothetical protein FAI40_06725 [Acetobacteraceae bacterium]